MKGLVVMDINKLDKWANLLLDTGKKNNLINFRDNKTSTVDIVAPKVEDIIKKNSSSKFYKLADSQKVDTNKSEVKESLWKKSDSKNQILLFKSNENPINIIKNIDKKSKENIEETGVNVSYVAIGFVDYKEGIAPVLLAPVTFKYNIEKDIWYINISEDIVVNPTFNFKINQENNISLPEYEYDGIEKYLDRVEEIIRPFEWQVKRESKIGIFSFLKMNMYKDITENKDLIVQNSSIRKMLGEKNDSDIKIVESGEYHLDNPLLELHNVVDADSSQIEAIEMAKSGLSFVLQGPPGTGKSQTITNIIAECIYDDKKVLFVSEKQAALNVVYNKLKRAGLEDFCLELHSYKANKKDVVEELCRTLKANEAHVYNQADKVILSKENSQKELDEYVHNLHIKQDVINKSLYECFDTYLSYKNVPTINFHIDDINEKDTNFLLKTSNLLRKYVDYAQSIGYNYKDCVWYGYSSDDTSYQMREQIRNSITKILEHFLEINKLQNHLKDRYAIVANSYENFAMWRNFFKLVSKSRILTPAFFKHTSCKYLLENVDQMQKLAIDISKLKDSITREYYKDIFEIDYELVYKKLTREFNTFLSRTVSSDYKKIVKLLKFNSRSGKKPSYIECLSIVEDIVKYYAKLNKFEELEEKVKPSLGNEYVGIDSDWDEITRDINELKQIFMSGAYLNKLENMTIEEYEKNKVEFSIMAREISNVLEKNRKYVELLKNNFDNEIFDITRQDFTIVRVKLNACLEEFEQIDNWCGFNKILCQMKKYNLLEYIDYAIATKIKRYNLVDVYEKNFYRQWIDYIQSTMPVISTFKQSTREKYVEQFWASDVMQFDVNKSKIKSKLSKKRPSIELLSSDSIASIILNEEDKKTKQKSIRQLLEETRELVQEIKPCFLMSPLSVSTFLTAKDIEFDVVIFDEASQIFPQDALGAIYRGKQLIVVGDSKQMPPSNFFNNTVGNLSEKASNNTAISNSMKSSENTIIESNNQSEDSSAFEMSDYESILEMCIHFLPQIRLRWHYRSKFEQLIAFSNRNFYEKELITFPSAVIKRDDIGVDYCKVPGMYNHKARTNEVEARKVIDIIFENLNKYPQRSIGVVAFNKAQQELIENMLYDRRKANPNMEKFFSEDLAEPIFIKNLETVQGDERDTIIFSIAYSKDENGKLKNNFGPLNKAGGERRLNVAITRAKCNIKIVTSIEADDIDLENTNSNGTKLLKEYLKYAKDSKNAALSDETNREVDSELVIEICDFLRENGFMVDTKIGFSNYQIDIGVKDPNTLDYVLAIECDGRTYSSFKNTRDRERLRQQVLESMGWKYYRIWSAEWYKNKETEKTRLLDNVVCALGYQNADYVLEKMHYEPLNMIEETPIETNPYADREKYNYISNFGFPKYELADIVSLKYACEQNKCTLQELLIEILKVEAPLSEAWILERISWFYNSEFVDENVCKCYEADMANCGDNGIIRMNGFLYLKEQNNITMRVPSNIETKRQICQICREEITAGILTVVDRNLSVDKNWMYNFLAHELGYNELNEMIIEKFDEALELLSCLINIDGDILSIKR
ncbi:DUF4011 domain-containing protein [Lachnobacterium bovis]|nr:DUF4011 domain-containing protein [Lachnobacterium bovis]